MKKILTYSVIALAALASCAKMENPVPPVDENGGGNAVYELTVRLCEMGTKTSIGYDSALKKHPIYWENGDIISAGTTMSNPLEGIEDRTTSQAVFTFASQIYNKSLVRYPGTTTPDVLVIPSQQNSVGGQYDPNAAPLWGIVDIDATEVPQTNLIMNNTMAMLKFEITGSATLTHATIEAIGGESINGTFDFANDGTVSNGRNASPKTDITFNGNLQLSSTPTELYIPILPATYSKGFTLQLYDSEGKLMKVSFFKQGQTLTEKNLARFSIAYVGGRIEVVAPLNPLDSEGIEFDQANIQGLKIGTYNILAEEDRGTLRTWDNAMPYVAGIIAGMDCDIICFQEISTETYSTASTHSLENAVRSAGSTDYTFKINNPNESAQKLFVGNIQTFTYANGFAYKADKVTLNTMGKFWLNIDNYTDDNFSLLGDDIDAGAGGKRTCVWGKFTEKSSGKVFYVLSTHLSIPNQDKGETIDGNTVETGTMNLLTAKYLITGIRKHITTDTSAKIILAGDLNSSSKHPTNFGFSYLTGVANSNWTSPETSALLFTDARDHMVANGTLPITERGILGTSLGEKENANNPSRLKKEECRYDHILFRNLTNVTNYTTHRMSFRAADGSDQYPSDHTPISVYVEL